MLVDIGLISTFMLAQAIASRASAKRILNLGTYWERSFFVLQSAILLHSMMHFWQSLALPSGSELVIWDVRGSFLEKLLLGLFIGGFATSFTSSFLIDHFELFGLSQGFDIDINRALGLAPPDAPPVQASIGESPPEGSSAVVVCTGYYKYVAHPMMAGIIVGFWSTPFMTASRFLFAAFNTTYIILAVRLLEERDLQEKYGEAYEKYLDTVPRFFPRIAFQGEHAKEK